MSDQNPQSPRNDDLSSLIAQGAALHEAGRLEEAARIYRDVLARSPHDFDATHLLGVIALQQGRFDVAQRLINGALVLNPGDVAAVSNLGISYLRAGQLEPALKWFEIALKLQPDSSVALTNAGETLYSLGRFRSAMPLLQRACSVDPTSYAAHSLLGACFLKIGDEQNAAAVLEAATRLQPDNADAWANLSLVLGVLGDGGRARECADRAARLKPDSTTALHALASSQFEQGRDAEALESYRRGISQAPSVDMLVSFAQVLMANGLSEEAREQLRRAAALDDRNVTVRWALALGQLKTIYESEAEVAASREALSRSLDDLKTWYESTPELEAPYAAVGTIQPFWLAYQNRNNRELLMRYGALCAAFMSRLPRPALSDPPDAPVGRKLRLGIVSGQIREHSVFAALIKGWLHHLDRDRFEIHAFHLSTVVDQETEAAMKSLASFDNRPKSLSAWVEALSRARLDVILYPEIGMDPLTVKLASMRLAPVQATSWGHPETSGLPTIDLFLSARAFEPAQSAQDNYSERLVKLPNLGVYVEPLRLPNVDPDLESMKLPLDQPLLLCPGLPFKYAPQYDEVWVRIAKGLEKRSFLRKSSTARLIFFRGKNDAPDRALEKRLRAAFERGAVDFDAHVSVVPFLRHAEFFGLMRRSALMLDTLGFSGFNTALQGIECDLPVLAFEGDFLRGRLASALLRELDLPELVATTPDDFVQKAVSLAKDPEKIESLRRKIVERRAGLFHNMAPVRELENCLMEAALAPRRGSGG
jgi:protein O-GlcNAc transferase